MKMSGSFIRKHIADLEPYEPIMPLDVLSNELGIPIGDLVKLDANENPYGMSPTARERLNAITLGHIYPDPESRNLRQALSETHGMPYDTIAVGAGADELIDLIVRLTMDPGDIIIQTPPTFGFYPAVAQVHNLQQIIVRRNTDFSLDLDGIKRASARGGKLIFLANPNNPDGGTIPPKVLDAILKMPLLVVLDEAYVEFTTEKTSRIRQVLSRQNLIVLRTFSKWGGLAGLRLGYGFFPPIILAQLMKIKQPYNVSVTASEAGLGALNDFSLLNDRRDWIIQERQRLYEMLLDLDWVFPYPSQANFILCRIENIAAKELKENLFRKGILIRYFNKPGLHDHVRFSVGSPQNTDRLIRALKEIAP
jgi:histidinol-phosphate aminotransferase